MDLEELLVNAYDRGRRVVIVEAPGKSQDKATAELSEVTKELFDRPVNTVIMTPDQFKGALNQNGYLKNPLLKYLACFGFSRMLKTLISGLRPRTFAKASGHIKKSDIVLFSGYTPGGFPSLQNVLIAASSMKELQARYPDMLSTNYAVVLPSQETDGPLKKVWEQMLRTFIDGETGQFRNYVHGPFAEPGSSSSLVGVLRNKAGVLKHNVGSLKDARFMDSLSAQFASGCNQTTTEKTFLCINDKLKEKKGKFKVINHQESTADLDFRNYYAVFIDNDWDNQEGKLGNGMNSLMNVSRALEKQGINIPIIYQTAHSLDSLGSEDRARISAFPNTYLVPKNLAPKVSRSKKVAIKELEASRLLRKCPALAEHVVESVPIGEQGFIKISGRFLTFTKAVVAPEDSNYKGVLGSVQREYAFHRMAAHKIYVLSELHPYLQGEINNPALALVGKRFKDFDEILESIRQHDVWGALETSVTILRSDYEQAVRVYCQLSPTTIIHNDAKWDNWFADCVLGDFGSMCPGRESKDLASILLNPENDFKETLDVKATDKSVKIYHTLRRAMKQGFDQPLDQLRKEVYGMLVVESLKQAFYKVAYDIKLTSGLIQVAEKYASLISHK